MTSFTLLKRPGISVAAVVAASRARSASHRPSSRLLSSKSCVQLPQKASVVVCGGGVIGTSVAYHLSKAGVSDVVLLESGSFSCGSTWHAVGLMGIPLGGSTLATKYRRDTIELIPELEKDSGCDTGFKQCGGLMVARNRDRLTALHHQHNFSKIAGVEAHLLNPEECLDKCPLLNLNDVLAGLWNPGEGTLSSSDLCQAYVKGAQALGAVLLEGTPVVGLRTEGRRVVSVTTPEGDIQCDTFVNCAGQWARHLAQLTDPPVTIPLHSVEHFYIVTQPLEGVPRMLPFVREVDHNLYLREWGGAVMVGGFEPKAKPVFTHGIPDKFEYQLFPEDWEQFSPLMEAALYCFPVLQTAQVRHMTNGPESFTPDSKPIVGRAPELTNYFVVAGLNSLGISSSGGLGRALAQWIVSGREPMDMWSVDLQRFSPHTGSPCFLRERVRDVVGTHYMIPYPRKEFSAGRGLRTPALYHEMDKAGAVWGQRMGWEVPLWFAAAGQERENTCTFGKPNWFENVEAEHAAACSNVALFDLSSYAKLEIEGQGVAGSFQRLCCSNVGVASGRVLRTGMLNDKGCLHTLCWVVRISSNKYLIVNVPELETRDHSWMRDHLPNSVRLSNVTGHYATLALVGPKATELLGRLTHTSLQKADFSLSTAKLVDVGTAANVLLVRGTSLGQDNGWELHVPSESAASVHRSLVAAGRDLGLCHAGMHALDSLRLEAGQVQWGRDVSAVETPYESGLGHLVCAEGVDFIGREALASRQGRGVHQRLCLLEMEAGGDVEVWPRGSEPVLRNGQVVGSTQSVAFGFHRGCHLATALLLPHDQGASGLSEEFCLGELSVMVGEKCYKATLKQSHLS